MVPSLGKLVDVKQHGAQHIKKPLWRITRSAINHQHKRAQHRRQGGVFIANDLQGGVRHGVTMAQAPGSRLDLPQSLRSRQRLSSSALEITLTLDSAIAAPATTGLKNPSAARGMPATL